MALGRQELKQIQASNCTASRLARSIFRRRGWCGYRRGSRREHVREQRAMKMVPDA